MNDNNWYATVTTKNIEEVARLLKLYLGGKKYTTVHCYEYKGFEPECRVHQQLEGGKDSKMDGDPANVNLHFHNEKHAQITICDSYGVGGFSTTKTEPGYDPTFNAPYIAFEWGNQIKLTHRAPNGLLIHELFVVE